MNGAFTVHRLDFAQRSDAAAFLAALSRFVSSPRGDAFRIGNSPVRVWVFGDEPALLLSGSALAAAGAAFSPLPAAHAISALPAAATMVLDGDHAEALGLEEAERRLTGVAADRQR